MQTETEVAAVFTYFWLFFSLPRIPTLAASLTRKIRSNPIVAQALSSSKTLE